MNSLSSSSLCKCQVADKNVAQLLINRIIGQCSCSRVVSGWRLYELQCAWRWAVLRTMRTSCGCHRDADKLFDTPEADADPAAAAFLCPDERSGPLQCTTVWRPAAVKSATKI